MGPVAAVERVQCELWRGGEGTRARVFAALRCRRDAVHWHGEGTVRLLTGGLCGSVSSSTFFLFQLSLFLDINFKHNILPFHPQCCLHLLHPLPLRLSGTRPLVETWLWWLASPFAWL